MNATIGTFEEYLEALRPFIRRQVLRQLGGRSSTIITGMTQKNFRQRVPDPNFRTEWFKHPFISWADLEQECALKLWKVYEQHRESKPWQDLCRIGGSAIKGCIFDVIDRTRVRGQAKALVLSLDQPIEGGSADFTSILPDEMTGSPIEEAEAVEALEAVSESLAEAERLIFRELVAMSNRTLEVFEDIRRTAHRNKPTDIVRFEAIARALEVPFKAVLAVASKLRGIGEGRSDAPRY